MYPYTIVYSYLLLISKGGALLQEVPFSPIGEVYDYDSIEYSSSCRQSRDTADLFFRYRWAQGLDGHSSRYKWGHGSGYDSSRYRSAEVMVVI